MSYCYRAFGVVLSLPFECRLFEACSDTNTADVALVYGVVPRSLPEPVAQNDTWEHGSPWQAKPGQFLVLGGQKAGRFLVEDGDRITLEHNSEAEHERIEHLLSHIVLAAVLRQRGELVLHANAVVTPRGVVVISGESGAGKSTTLAAFHHQGHGVLSDDLTVLRATSSKVIEVLPGAPQVYLCEDAALELGQNIEELERNPFRRNKVISPLRERAAAAPLAAIYWLETVAGSSFSCVPLSGAEKFKVLQSCLYGPLLREGHHDLFPLIARLAAQTPIFRIQRPAGVWTVDAVMQAILNA